jgi:transposase-like protein
MTEGLSALEIEGTAYLTMSEVARQVGVMPQASWRRWRKRTIQLTWRFRDRASLYTETEAQVSYDQQARFFDETSPGKR